MIEIKGEGLSLSDVVRIARFHEEVRLSDKVISQVAKSRTYVEAILKEEKAVYGITTGFGELAKIPIDADDREALQHNLIISHCTGVGELLSKETVRAAMVLRINSLSIGYSGIRVSTLQKLVELLNKDITPAVPSQGSVGASGDLAPLAHIAAVLLGEGFVLLNDKSVPAKPVLKKAGFTPIKLAGKEGLALINGTQIMSAIATLCAYDALDLMKVADIASALSLEALRGTRTALDMRISLIRPHQGQIQTAKNVLSLTENSKIIESHIDCDKVQDAYSLRCVPQVHGASKDALRRAIETILVEINSVTDNPLVMADTGEILSGGNFHGQPIALVMDYLKIALAEIGNISERRCFRLVDSRLSDLPEFLTAYPGVNSGYMIPQYTAASLVSENKVLAHPASVDSIPTSANQEDHVSMGTIAARQARMILENVRQVLAIEMMMACQGIDFLAPLTPGKGTAAVHACIRKQVLHLDKDRMPAPDIAKIYQAIVNQELISAAEDAGCSLEAI